MSSPLQMRVADMSKQMRDMRKEMENNTQLKSLMAGLRGQNIDDSDFADANVVMRLVEVDRDEQDILPQVSAQHPAMHSIDTHGEQTASSPRASPLSRRCSMQAQSSLCALCAADLQSCNNPGLLGQTSSRCRDTLCTAAQ